MEKEPEMAPNSGDEHPKVQKAVAAMQAIGISENATKRVLKMLLPVYKNWEPIEEENYRLLADMICEEEENQERKKRKTAQPSDHTNTQLKRLDSKSPENRTSSSTATQKRTPTTENGEKEEMSNSQTLARRREVKDRVDLPGFERKSNQNEDKPTQTRIRADVGEKKPVSRRTHSMERVKDNHSPSQGYTRQDIAGRPLARSREVKDKADLAGLKPKSNKKEDKLPQTRTRTDVVEQKSGLHRTHSTGKVKDIGSSSQGYPRKDKAGVSRDFHMGNRSDSGSISRQVSQKTKGKEPMLFRSASRKSGAVHGRLSMGVSFKEPKTEHRKLMVSNDLHNSTLMEHRTDTRLVVPIAMVHPLNEHPDGKEDGEDGEDDISPSGQDPGPIPEPPKIPEDSYSNFEIVLSPQGEVRISLSCCSSTGRPDFKIPSLDAILKLAGDEGLKSHKIVSPSFSLVEVMEDLCQCFLGLTTERTNGIGVTQSRQFLKKLNACAAIRSDASDEGHNDMASRSSNGLHNSVHRLGSEPSNYHNSMLLQHPNFNIDGQRPPHNLSDISNGHERVKIRVVNHINNEQYPPRFHYISRNTVYQNAYVNFALARIGDQHCCSDCFGDCVTSPIPCACTAETGGLFAYTADGLVKKEFLDESILITRDPAPAEHHLYYCEECPLERGLRKCKGHLLRKFIKECWNKCGCDYQCGNRVVQRGITRDLEVFFTSEEKGWGLRTVEDLPRGAFVCEYVGEILTNTELYYRNENAGNERHTYPVLLDADWGSEGILDEEALCLDATRYGNVARFINHRCHDANLVELPVEIETPDHHYYHIAFFTSRAVAASEELTWDYRIDFDNVDHPIKAFQCQCGSRYCRDIKRAQCSKLNLKALR